MDSESTILGLAILLTCITPILILKIRSNLKKRKFTGLLYELAKKHNTTISQYDHWNASAIGLNKNGTQAFSISIYKDEEKQHELTLSSFTKCIVVNNNAGAAYKEGSFKVTNGIDLKLLSKNGQDALINFYNIENDDPLLTDELELAEKWCKIINECIAQRA
jgi:hypothetical protein